MTLARAVARRAGAVVAGALGVVGVATAGLLHVEAGRQLDQALVTATEGGGPTGWSLDHRRPGILLRVVEAGDPDVPADLLARVLDRERPELFDRGPDRVAIAIVERRVRDGEVHRWVEARARRLAPLGTVGPFFVIYAPLALATAWLASGVLHRGVSALLRPLERARGEAEALASAVGEGRPEVRLTEDGPPEVRALVTAVNLLLERLESAGRAQARFATQAAHELRTPVTSLLLGLDLALRRPRPAAELEAALRSARDEADRMGRLVAGLLALARLEGIAPGDLRAVAVADLVREALATEGATAEVVAPAGLTATVHPELAAIALRNLVRNAVRHAPGAAVRVSAARVGDRVTVTVDDAGPGVSPEDREAVFDTFARTGGARLRDPEGLGLGLPLAREIARRHGGECTLSEAPGGGCRAALTLPA